MLKGIIVSSVSGSYWVEVENDLYECNARGRFKKDDVSPVVGDRVLVDIVDEENKKAVIEEILERENYIKRPKLANITKLVLVLSAKMPKPDLLMLDKQLAFAEYLKIKPIIVINKIDLSDVKEIEKIYKDLGYTVITTCAKENLGVDKLKEELKNSISAFSGNSGVGKSTLLNNIFKDSITQEGDISKKNKKGKNTTTRINLYKLAKNEYIADTPRIFNIRYI